MNGAAEFAATPVGGVGKGDAASLDGDASQDYFVDGLVEDITVALGRESWLFVIANASQ